MRFRKQINRYLKEIFAWDVHSVPTISNLYCMLPEISEYLASLDWQWAKPRPRMASSNQTNSLYVLANTVSVPAAAWIFEILGNE